MTRTSDLATILLVGILWGAAFTFLRSAVAEFNTLPMVGVRFVFAVAVLMPLMLIRQGVPDLRRNLVTHLTVGVLFTAVPFFFIGTAVKTLPGATVALLNATAPLFATLVGVIVLREPVGAVRATGLIAGFGGVLLLVSDKLSLGGDDATLAVLLVLGTALMWGLATQYVRVRAAHIDPLEMSAVSITIAMIVFAPLAVADWPAQMPGLRAWIEVAFLGVVCTGAGTILYFNVLRRAGAVPATTIGFVCPPAAMVSSALYLGEPVTPRMLAACAIILLGTWLVIRPKIGRRVVVPERG
jgi:drug/metabolite transporter (DMT)-like permease